MPRTITCEKLEDKLWTCSFEGSMMTIAGRGETLQEALRNLAEAFDFLHKEQYEEQTSALTILETKIMQLHHAGYNKKQIQDKLAVRMDKINETLAKYKGEPAEG